MERVVREKSSPSPPVDAEFVRAVADPTPLEYFDYTARQLDNGTVQFTYQNTTVQVTPSTRVVYESDMAILVEFAKKVTIIVHINPLMVTTTIIQRLWQVGAFQSELNATHNAHLTNSLVNMLLYSDHFESVQAGIWLLDKGFPCISIDIIVDLVCPAGYRLARDFFRRSCLKKAGFNIHWNTVRRIADDITHIKTMLADIFAREEELNVPIEPIIMKHGVEIADWMISRKMVSNSYKWREIHGLPTSSLRDALITRGFTFAKKPPSLHHLASS